MASLWIYRQLKGKEQKGRWVGTVAATTWAAPPPTSLSSSAGDSHLKGCGAPLCPCAREIKTERERAGERESEHEWVAVCSPKRRVNDKRMKMREEMLSSRRLQPLLFGVWMILEDEQTDVQVFLEGFQERRIPSSLSSPQSLRSVHSLNECNFVFSFSV